MEMKVCTKCKSPKPFSGFCKGQSTFGLSSWCKRCTTDGVNAANRRKLAEVGPDGLSLRERRAALAVERSKEKAAARLTVRTCSYCAGSLPLELFHRPANGTKCVFCRAGQAAKTEGAARSRAAAKSAREKAERAARPAPAPYAPPAEKPCSHCKVVKPLAAFPTGTCRDGKNSWCRQCANAQSNRAKKRRCDADPAYREALAQAKRADRRATDSDLGARQIAREIDRALKAQVQQALRGAKAALQADAKAHVDAYRKHLARRPGGNRTREEAAQARTEADLLTAATERAKSAYRRARRLGRVVPWCRLKDTIPVYYEAALTEFHMRVQWDVDHEIPLRGDIVSGLHVLTNLVPKPRVLNEIKSNQFAI